jgi:hypothetical protein
MSVYIVRAFVRWRSMMETNAQLSRKRRGRIVGDQTVELIHLESQVADQCHFIPADGARRLQT